MTPETHSLDRHLTDDPGLSPLAASALADANTFSLLDESVPIFAKSLQLGRVRGVVGVVDDPDAGTEAHSMLRGCMGELINRDILVVCLHDETQGMQERMAPHGFLQSAGDGLAEFCDFIGIHPVLHVSAAAGLGAMVDLYSELARAVEVQCSDLPVAMIHLAIPGPQQGELELLGRGFRLEGGPVEIADLVDHHIHEKRTGLQWGDRCGGRFSPFS